MKLRKPVCGFTLLLLPLFSISQDLSKISAAKPFKITGGINSNGIYNSANAENPWSYYLGANLNLDFYGWNIPISFSYSNRQHSFNHPFNQYGLSPTFKWLTIHLGYRSMSFSRYSYSGVLFKGAGIEVNSDLGFKVQTFYGQLQKAVAADTITHTEAAFERIGYGTRLEYSFSGNSFNFSLFRAIDDRSSLNSLPEYSEITPHENLVYTFGGTINPISGLTVNMELASSAFSKDITNEPTEPNNNLFKYSGKLFTSRESSGYYWAGKTDISYSFLKSTLGLNYEIITPGFITLGQYYTKNDLETFSLNYGQSLFQDKMNLSFSAGLERNNLGHTEVEKTSRFVFAAALAMNFSEKFHVAGNFSSFRNYTNLRPEFDNLNSVPAEPADTLNFVQVSKSASLSVTWKIRASESMLKNLNLNFSHQGGINKRSPDNSNFAGFNESVSYLINWLKRETTISISVNSSQNSSEIIRTFIIGPAVSASKSYFGKKLRSALTLAYNSVTTLKTNSAFTSRITQTLSLKKGHKFNFGMGYSVRSHSITHRHGDLTITCGYSYLF